MAWGAFHLTEALRPRLRFTIEPERGIPIGSEAMTAADRWSAPHLGPEPGLDAINY